MRKSYLIGFSLLTLCCCQRLFAKQQESAQILKVTVEVISTDESIKLRNPKFQGEEYFMIVTLNNIQDTTVSITIMDCSWSESFIFDSDSLSLTYPGCDSNIPVTIEITAHSNVKFYAKLMSKKKANDYRNPFAFKIGFVDLDWAQLLTVVFRAPELKQQYKTYWSDTVYLRSRLYNYKINNRP